MSNNISVLLAGCGYMGKEYYKVLRSQNIEAAVVGRGEKSAADFELEMGCPVIRGGIESAMANCGTSAQYGIAAVGVEQLHDVVLTMIEGGIPNILVEKPAGINRQEIEDIAQRAEEYKAKVYVAYNRRFYASTEKALEIIQADGGVKSFNFEFTEWADSIEKTEHADRVKENWLLANSSHVIDLAFFLGGEPEMLDAFVSGNLPWHKRGSAFAGAGRTKTGVLFSYQANWDAPGRWSVEVLTKMHRLFFKPMEKLAVQNRNSTAVEPVEIDDQLDERFKPGLYNQCRSFMEKTDSGRLPLINEHLNNLQYYEKIAGIK